MDQPQVKNLHGEAGDGTAILFHVENSRQRQLTGVAAMFISNKGKKRVNYL